MQKRVSDIANVKYGQDGILCEPSCADIRRAIDQNDLENRCFQPCKDALLAEWYATGKLNPNLAKQYHARRIAFFVVNGWTELLELKDDGRTLEDGLHRLKAAIFLGRETVDVCMASDRTSVVKGDR